MKTHTADVLAD